MLACVALLVGSLVSLSSLTNATATPAIQRVNGGLNGCVVRRGEPTGRAARGPSVARLLDRRVRSVSLTSTARSVEPGGSVRLTAAVRPALRGRGDELYLVDATTNDLVSLQCTTRSTCQTEATWHPNSQRYVAIVAKSGLTVPAPFRDAKEASPSVTLISQAVDVPGWGSKPRRAARTIQPLTSWGGSITLATSTNTLSSPQTATLTATASKAFSPSYVIDLVDESTTPHTFISDSSSGLKLIATVPWSATAQTYVAYVASFAGVPTGAQIQATSNTETISPTAWSVSMTATTNTLSTGQSATLTVTPNQGVTPYVFDIVDETTNTLAADATSGTSLQWTAPWTPTAQTYVAYVAKVVGIPTGSQIIATSGTETISPQPWSVSLSASGSGKSTLTFTMNQSLTSSGYAAVLYDIQSESEANSSFCNQGKTCQFVTSGNPQIYEAFVLNQNTGAYPPAGIIAQSGAVWSPDAGPDGNENPSENNCGCSSGDPVFTDTGELMESATDLSVPGRGVPLSFTRSFDSFNTEFLGWFGWGWTDNYAMYLFADPTSPTQGVLSSASPIDLRQEDGTLVSFTRNADGSYSAPSRVLATLAYNANGTFTFVRKGQVSYVFSSVGQLVSESDPNGYVTTLGYTNGLLTSINDPAGRSITLSYNSAGFVSQIKDSSGRVVTYGYNPNGNGQLVSVSDPAGNKTQFSYDANFRLTTITDPNGNVTTNHYNSADQVDYQIDGAGRKTTYDYNATGSVIVQHQLGDEMLEQYAGSELFSQTLGLGTSSAATTTFTYDPATLGVATATDPNTHTWHFTYGSAGNETSRIDPIGDTETATYNGFDEPLTVTAPAPDSTGGTVTTTNTYDSHGNILTSSTPVTSTQTATTHYTYGDAFAGDVTAVQDPNGATTNYAYDSYGQLASEIDPMGNKTSYTYTCTPAAAGCRSNIGWTYSMVTPRGNASTPSLFTWKYAYKNDDGDLLSAMDPLGHTTKYTYDSDNNVATVTDPNLNLTQYAYNGDNQPTITTRADGSRAKITYDDDGNVQDQTTGYGTSFAATTTYTYDPLNRVETMTTPPTASYPAGIVTTYGYDSKGDLTSVAQPGTAGATLTTSYDYDDANRLTNIQYSDGLTHNVAISYYPNGERESMIDGTGTSNYTYNLSGWLVNAADGGGNVVGDSYDLDGNVTSITYPNGQTITRGFNPDDELSSVTDWNSNTTKFIYDPDGNLFTTAFPNGVSLAESSDNADNPSTITYSKAGNTLDAFTATRDPDGNITGNTVTGSTVGTSSTFMFNLLNQVKQVTDTALSGNYVYDQAGDLTGEPSGTTQTYDPTGELTSSATGTQTTTYSNNPTGDRASAIAPGGVTQGYSYDQANRLVGYTNPFGTTTTYAYNGDGLRTSKTTGANASTFSWDQASGAPPLLLSDGSTDYIYGPGGVPLEEIGSDGFTSYLLTDQQGSVRALTGPTGALAGVYDYDPYGNVINQVGRSSSLRYAGQYQDDESGLYYMRARYEDPVTGTFLSRDPLVAGTGQPYSYAGDNPISNADPSGLDWFSDFNPIHFFEEEIHAYESGCSYWDSIKYGFEGTFAAVTDIFAFEDGEGEAALAAEAAEDTGAAVEFTADAAEDATSGGVGIARITPGSLPADEESALDKTVGYIDSGTTPSGGLAKNWGAPFRNWNGDLPGGVGENSPYEEYRVSPPAGTSGAGPLRVVYNPDTGDMYYTWTHYGDSGYPPFVQIR